MADETVDVSLPKAAQGNPAHNPTADLNVHDVMGVIFGWQDDAAGWRVTRG